MARLVVIHRLEIQRGSSPLGASQLRENPLFHVESDRLRRQPGSPSAGQSAPLPLRLTPGRGQMHSAYRRTVPPPTFPSTARRGDLPIHTPGHRAPQGSRSVQRCSCPQGTAPPPPPPHPRIPKRPAQGNGRSNPVNRSDDTSGRSPLTPRQQQPPRSNNQVNAQAPNNNNRNCNNRRPFSRSTAVPETPVAKEKGLENVRTDSLAPSGRVGVCVCVCVCACVWHTTSDNGLP